MNGSVSLLATGTCRFVIGALPLSQLTPSVLWPVGSYGSVSGLGFDVLDISAHHRILAPTLWLGRVCCSEVTPRSPTPNGQVGDTDFEVGRGWHCWYPHLQPPIHPPGALMQAVGNSAVGTGTARTQSTLSPPAMATSSTLILVILLLY